MRMECVVMISVAPRHDKLPTVEERAAKYKEEIDKRPDIIESDIPNGSVEGLALR